MSNLFVPDFTKKVSKNILNFSNEYKLDYIKKFYRCSKCGEVLDAPGTCPNCGADVN